MDGRIDKFHAAMVTVGVVIALPAALYSGAQVAEFCNGVHSKRTAEDVYFHGVYGTSDTSTLRKATSASTPGSEADFFAHLIYDGTLARQAAGAQAPDLNLDAGRSSFWGGHLALHDRMHDDTRKIDKLDVGPDDLVSSFDVDAVAVRDLVIHPGSGNSASTAYANVEFVGAYEPAPDRTWIVVLLIASDNGATTPSYRGAVACIASGCTTDRVSGVGSKKLFQGGRTFAVIDTGTSEAPTWVDLPMKDKKGKTRDYWVTVG